MQKTADTRNVNPLVLAVSIFLADVATDRATKWIAMKQFADGGLSLIPNVLGTTHHQNYGVLANIPIPLPIIITLTMIALYFLGTLLKRSLVNGHALETMGVASIMAGAVGNLWDRVTMGYVFDWILLFNRSVINLADFFIIEGIVLFLIAQQLKKRPPTSLDVPLKTP